jgi:hypothetical protein
MSNVEEVHQVIQSYRVMLAGAHLLRDPHSKVKPLCSLPPSAKEKLLEEFYQQQRDEQYVIQYLKERDLHDWSWASGGG